MMRAPLFQARRPPRQERYNYGAYLRRKTSKDGDGCWSPQLREWLCVLSDSECILIAHLLTMGRARADERGWLMATPAYLACRPPTGLNWPASKADRIIGELEAQGILTVRTRDDGKRYVRVEYAELDRQVKRAMQG